ncbi:MAG TPA: glycosyltransferase family 2 protein [Verrucomicrobiae bacterium]|nr:glycosyltransferase family 2 protein [Verrucomicrobiae bacterium]
MNLADITPLILTFNEAPNIDRSLAALSWASEVVVVDSNSTDATRDILARYPEVRVVARTFAGHAAQWNVALRETGVTTPWVLALDADYRLSEALVAEIRDVQPPEDISGFRVPFVYLVDGKLLRGSLYPPSIVLFRRERGEYVQDGHTQRLRLVGRIAELRNPIYHDDRKSFDHWRNAQRKYMRLEARKLRSTPLAQLSWPDRARRFLLGPVLVVPYCLFGKGLVLDGSAGLKYTGQRFYTELLLAGVLVRGAD